MAATTLLSPQELQGLCRRYLHQSGHTSKPADDHDDLQVLNYTLKPTSDTVAGFLGRHQFLTVDVRFKPADNEPQERIEKLCFFTKSAPTEMESRMQYLEEFGVFKKEILVYREVLPELQKIFGEVAPKCYYADSNLLVFENLSEQGFKMAAERDGLLNYEHLNRGVRTLAALHAASIVYEVRKGSKISELHKAAVKENAYPANLPGEHVRMQNFNNAVEVLKEMIKTMPKYQQADMDYIQQEFPKQMARIFDLCQPSEKYQNVFSHGDLWANNMMFVYSKYGEIPIHCRLVDFQLSRYAPPLLDLFTMLTIPTSRDFRAQHFSVLVGDYIRFMREFLKREQLNLEDYLPAAHIDAMTEEFSICGLIESCLFSHLTIMPPESTQELTGTSDGFSDFFTLKRVEICMKAFKTDRVYRERLTDMLEDIVDNFVLKNK